jgi:ectoine hydroxylase
MHLKAYQRDGFVRVPGFFDAIELEPLLDAYRQDPSVRDSLYGMVDSEGAPHPICIWTELGDDIIGLIPRMTRMVDATEALMAEPCYHWHSKITVKPPGCVALIDWHQDFASWYDDGVPFPKLLTVGIAVEPATKQNGCLQLVPGSHEIGRMDFLDAESFEKRLEHARRTLGVVYCEMKAGDAVFFHCNTLHGSASNESDTSRLMLFVSYNAVSNEPIRDAQGANEEGRFMNISPADRLIRPLMKVPDDVLRKKRFKSAFDHTAFKTPLAVSGVGYTKAARLG